MIRAWDLEYYGFAYEVMLQAIDEIHGWPVEQHYAKVLPVAQSSGTGKSKSMDMIARQRITFPFCLREDLGNDYFGM